ncbi:MAG: EF-hand domain-containing protein [Planctomycetota bacterium]
MPPRSACLLTLLAWSAACAQDITLFATTTPTSGDVSAALPEVRDGDTIYLWVAASNGTATPALMGLRSTLTGATGVLDNDLLVFGTITGERFDAQSDLTWDPEAYFISVLADALDFATELDLAAFTEPAAVDVANNATRLATLTVVGDNGVALEVSDFGFRPFDNALQIGVKTDVGVVSDTRVNARSTPFGGLIAVPAATGNPCPPDQNSDGQLDIDDFSRFVTNFFSSDPLADVNNDNALDIDDFSDFVSAFFNPAQFPGCP